MAQINTYTFPNGFRVIHQHPIHPNNIAYVNVFCRVGSINETDNTRGVSHFIEHMCFKGTRKLPTARDIFEVYDDIGAYFNAYTEKQITCYVSYFQHTHLNHCLSTLGDMLFNSTFSKHEYFKEMNVVVEENVNKKHDNENVVKDITESMLYKGTAYSYPVDSLTYHKILDPWEYRDVIDFYEKYYVPENMLISIVSQHPFASVIKSLRQTEFVKRNVHKSSGNIRPFVHAPLYTEIIMQREMKIERVPADYLENTHIAWGIRTCSIFSEDRWAIKFLKIVLGGKFTSRLNTILRENHGLTYTSNVSTNFYEHSGDITIYTVTANRTLIRSSALTNHNTTLHTRGRHRRKTMRKRDSRGVLPIIADLVRDLIRNGLTEYEMEHTKRYIEGSMKMQMETSKQNVEYNGVETFLANKTQLVPFNKLYETEFATITRSQLHEIIRKYFTPENTNVVILGGNLPSNSQITKYCARAFRR
jgi:predicted Zn-dependent peptidase